jgi:hypothetical protein
MRRPLGDTIAELTDVLAPDQDLLRLTGILLDLPMEMAMRESNAGLEFVADVPRWRWRTFFDQQPGRMRVELSAMTAAAAADLLMHLEGRAA